MTKEKAHKKDQKKEAEDYKDKWLRALAEYENLKKRFAKEKIEFLKFSNEALLLRLLPIIDDFDRAHQAAGEHKHGEVFSKGVEMILNKLHQLLEQNGVERIKTVGEKFDPHVHEAMTSVKTDAYPEDTVAEEIFPGYTLNGKLVRASKVKIAEHIEKQEEKEGEKKNG